MKSLILSLCFLLCMNQLLAQEARPDSEYALGIEAFNQEDYETAYLHFEKWIQNNPQDPLGYWYLGQVYENFEGDGVQFALENYSIALELNPELAEVYMSRGRLNLRLERYEFAEEDFLSYLRLPKGETTQVIYKKSATDRGFSGVFTAQTDNPSETLYHLGLSRMGMEDYPKALSYLDSAISYQDDVADFHAEKGKALMELGQESEALVSLKKAVEINPNHYLARQRIILLEEGGDKEKLEVLTQSISDDPENPQAWKLRGFHRLTHDDFEGAIADFTEAISIMQDDVENWNYRGSAFAKLKEWEKAEEDFSYALTLADQDPELLLRRGQARYYQNKAEEALADFVQLIALDPQNPTGYFHRGITFHRLDRQEEACQDLNQALSMGMEQAKPILDKICK
ncbi:tetratricopeptide repeat protein [Algoriphagus hitonicola]|uniref:Tetratricopeptide repeat-containing protein n=2 Tax=Algoriphagus hitonicola TaxID=435880 RepID=A0A1I2QMH9_9BACT|nr:Tetratricopeptide repeat-containing protein [Algoriphagus hitonicola]